MYKSTSNGTVRFLWLNGSAGFPFTTCVCCPWCSPEHVGFLHQAWFTALNDTVPISENSNHMSSCDLLLCLLLIS